MPKHLKKILKTVKMASFVKTVCSISHTFQDEISSKHGTVAFLYPFLYKALVVISLGHKVPYCSFKKRKKKETFSLL